MESPPSICSHMHLDREDNLEFKNLVKQVDVSIYRCANCGRIFTAQDINFLPTEKSTP